MNNQIKLILVVILFSLFMLVAACNSASTPKPETSSAWYNVQVIEDCEYIEVKAGIADNSVYSITHKGDCKNPIHCYNNVEKKEGK